MSAENPGIGPPPPKTWRLILTLGVAGLFSGLAIVGIFEVTLPRITANKAAALRRAVFEVLPGSSQMQRLRWTGTELIPDHELTPDNVVYGAYDPDGLFVGYAIPGEGPGFQDNINLIYGYLPSKKKIVGMQVLESRETPGLGDKIFKDANFVGNFRDLSVEPEVKLVKEDPENENEVDAITGATISSKAVVKIVNTANSVWLTRLPEPGAEPPLAKPPSDDAAALVRPGKGGNRRGTR